MSDSEIVALKLGTVVGFSENGSRYRGEVIREAYSTALEVMSVDFRITQEDAVYGRACRSEGLGELIIRVPRHPMVGVHVWDLATYCRRYDFDMGATS